MITQSPQPLPPSGSTRPTDPMSDLAAMYVGATSRRANGTPAKASELMVRSQAVLPDLRERGVLSSLLPLCVLMTGAGLGAYLYLFVHSLAMACLVGALGVVGSLFCRELLR
jgi:hypothetical protein